MKRRSLIASLFGIILIAVVALSATLIAGRSPLLGLDLRGGVSVVLQPHSKVKASTLEQAVNIIDRRVNKLGVANSTVERQGNDVVIDLPGVKDSQTAIKEVGQTAQLFFRPVDCTILPYQAASTSTTVPPSTSTTVPASTTTVPASPTTTSRSPSTTATRTSSTTGSTKKASVPASPTTARLTAIVTKGSSPTTSPVTTSPVTTSPVTTVPTSATTTPAGSATTVPTSTSTTVGGSPQHITTTDRYAYLADACGSTTITPNPDSKLTPEQYPSTNPNNDNPQYSVIVDPSPTAGVGTDRWVLGPADLKGEIVKTASAEYDSTNGEYVVNVTLTGKGLTAFNKIAKVRNSFYDASATTGQPFKALEAIDLDGALESAPSIDIATFTGPIQISGQFTSAQASALATELEYGSLPVKFDIGSINTVSATLGHSSLIAGLLAGLGGIVLVLLYMILYYRALGLVVVLGLGVGGALLYSILTELSQTSSLALTLSGITGVIVSIGITVDSYVVYFERLKDEVRQGRTIRSSVERGFTRAFKTVLTADLVSFLAALILYLFTVGDVKGFAFTLGLSTLLDVFTAYFFIRPIVVLLGRRRTTSERRFLGIARGLGAVRTEGA